MNKDGPIHPMPNSQVLDSTAALVAWPVDVWFDGSRTYKAALASGGRRIVKITLDPPGRVLDGQTADNVWPADSAPASAEARGRGGR